MGGFRQTPPNHHQIPPREPPLNRIALTLLAAAATTTIAAAQAPKCPAAASHINMVDGTFSSGPGVTFRLHHFAAALVPQGTTSPLCFQKLTVVSHADISVSNDSLTQVFAQKLDDSKTKITDFRVINTAGRATLTGKVKKVIPIDFSVSGTLSTDGTALSLNVDKIKADGIPIKALLGLVGEQLSAVFGMKDVPGVSVHENTISFLPEQIAHLKGHILAVDSTDAGLTLHYGAKPRTPAKHPAPAPASAPAAAPAPAPAPKP